MIERTKNAKDLADVTEPYRNELLGFEPENWLANSNNIALTDGLKNFSLFEFELDGIYTGHYFFGNARGREALAIAKEMVREAFSNHPIKVIRGLTPLEKLGARWLSRQTGFTSHGVVQTTTGPCELFILSKDEWENNNHG